MRTDAIIGTITVLVEVKRYRAPVSVSVVREVLGAMQFAHANKAVIITTSSFTTEARRLAENASIDLIDGLSLLELLLQYMSLRVRIGSMRIGEGRTEEA